MEMTGRRAAERSEAKHGSPQAVTKSTMQVHGASVRDLQQENESLREVIVSLSALVMKRVAERR